MEKYGKKKKIWNLSQVSVWPTQARLSNIRRLFSNYLQWSKHRSRLLAACFTELKGKRRNQGWIVVYKKKLTLLKALPTVLSSSGGVLSSNTWDDSRSRGSTLRNIKAAINNEHRGSAIKNPNCSISTEDTITPTLPMVSATTWRNTPVT